MVTLSMFSVVTLGMLTMSSVWSLATSGILKVLYVHFRHADDAEVPVPV